MPPIVTFEERQEVAGSKSRTRGAIRAFALGTDDEDRAPLLEQIAALMEESAHHTTEPSMSQIARIDITLRFRRLVKDALTLFIAKGLTRHPHDTSKDALSYDNVPALAERLNLFITHETIETKGRDSLSGAMPISKSAIPSWKLLLLKAVVLYVQEHETLDTIDAALGRVLKYSADSKQGVFYQLSNHVAHLITRFKLQSVSKFAGVYGAPEVQLILNDIFQRLPTGASAVPLLQKIALVQTCFITGLRIESLVATDKGNEERLGLRQDDVTFTMQEYGAWTLYLRIKQLKGYNAAEDAMQFTVRMRPLKKPSNFLLEPAVVFLTLLINRQALRADGPDGPLIANVKQLLASPSHRFVGAVDILMFQHGDNGELDVQAACNQLRVHTCAVGLPYGAFHRLRQDFAMQMQLLFGSATARELLHHNVENDALNRNYTGGIQLFDLVGIRTGEAAQDTAGFQSRRCRPVRFCPPLRGCLTLGGSCGP